MTNQDRLELGAPIPIPYADDYWRDRYDYDPDRHVESCLLCRRGLTAAAVRRGCYVEITIDGHLFHGWGESQGCFAVGPRCKARIPRALRLALSPPEA